MGPERGPASAANRQLCPRPLPFPWQRATMAQGEARICCCRYVRACSPGRTALANPSNGAENDEMEQETGVGCMYADCMHDRTSRVPPWAPGATVCHAHDVRQRC